MSRISNLPKNVPTKELPFHFKAKGRPSGFTYEGDFVVEVPSVRDMSAIGVELAKLNGGVKFESLDVSTANLNNAIAYLKVALKKSPNWFSNSSDDPDEEGIDYGLDTIDLNIPVEIFRKAEKLVAEWYKTLRGEPKDEKASTP